MEVVEEVFRQVRDEREAVDYRDVGISTYDLLYVFAELDERRDAVRIVAAPEGSDAEDRDLSAIDADKRLIVFFNVCHGLCAVLVGAEGDDYHVRCVTRHLHEGLLVVDVATDALV